MRNLPNHWLPRAVGSSCMLRCSYTYHMYLKSVTGHDALYRAVGDHMLIGKEMMRMLGQGTNMLSAAELPVVGSDGKVDEGLFNRYK